MNHCCLAAIKFKGLKFYYITDIVLSENYLPPLRWTPLLPPPVCTLEVPICVSLARPALSPSWCARPARWWPPTASWSQSSGSGRWTRLVYIALASSQMFWLAASLGRWWSLKWGKQWSEVDMLEVVTGENLLTEEQVNTAGMVVVRGNIRSTILNPGRWMTSVGDHQS